MLSPTERNTFITTALQFADNYKLPTNNYLGKSRLSFHNDQHEEFVSDHYFDYSKYSAVILKEFDLKESNLKIIQTLKPYIKQLNIKINFDKLRLHQYYKIGLKHDYTSLNDALYLSIQLVNINPSTKELQERITIRYYFTPIETYFKQYIFSMTDSDGFVLHVYHKDIESSLFALLEANKQKIEDILGYHIDHINQDTVNLLDMTMI